jgi:hypothetical protein
MRRRIEDVTPQYAASRKAFCALSPGEQDRLVIEVFGHKTMFKQDRQRYGKHTPGAVGKWPRLLGKRLSRLQFQSRLPFDDHVEMWRSKGGFLRYVSHSYARLGVEHIRELIEICEKHGLEIEVSALSWYYPGDTLRIEWRRKGDRHREYELRVENDRRTKEAEKLVTRSAENVTADAFVTEY